MAEKKRNSVAEASLLPNMMSRSYSQKDQMTGLELRHRIHSENIHSSAADLSTSRELILRLIEVLKDL